MKRKGHKSQKGLHQWNLQRKTEKSVKKKKTRGNRTRAPQTSHKIKNQDHLEPQRLNRILSLAGLTSRRKADEWIRSGRVKVKGETIREPGMRVVWGRDRIQVDNQDIPNPSPRLYLMLNKPFGYISSLKDPQGRPLATDLLKGIAERVYPVGRLDFDSLGLLFFTNDGEWAHRLMHPRFRVPRTYKVTVSGCISAAAIQKLGIGVTLENGTLTRAKVTLVSKNENQSILRMTIYQGLSRQVRRMLEAVGYKVIHLIRIGFGELILGDLKVGEYRHLETVEVEAMKKLVGLP